MVYVCMFVRVYEYVCGECMYVHMCVYGGCLCVWWMFVCV